MNFINRALTLVSVSLLTALSMSTDLKISSVASNTGVSVSELSASAGNATVPIAHGSTGEFHTASNISINFDPRFLKNGSKIYGVTRNNTDNDQKLQIIGDRNGNIMIKLLGTNKVISTANNLRHGSWLEVWDLIPGTYTQTFKAVPVGNGGFYIALTQDPTMGINLDGGRNQAALSLNKITLVNGQPDPDMVWYFNDIEDNRRDNHSKFTFVPKGTVVNSSNGDARYLPFVGTRFLSQGYDDTISHGDALNDYAIDIAMQTGEEVRSVAKGVVVASSYMNGWGGNVVAIRYSNGVIGHYIHLSSRDVVEGQNVSGGQLIGRVGGTFSYTKSFAPHLHYHEARVFKGNSIPLGSFVEGYNLSRYGINLTSRNFAGRN
jgi:murein DD-endopeptidase MepM/ murein hydrolase activator NlpD